MASEVLLAEMELSSLVPRFAQLLAAGKTDAGC